MDCNLSGEENKHLPIHAVNYKQSIITIITIFIERTNSSKLESEALV